MSTPRRKNPAAVALGKLGGSKGGKARWEGMTAEEQRAHIRRLVAARQASRARIRLLTEQARGSTLS